MWSSVQGKSYTLVILVTLVFAVWNNGHQTKTKLVGETRTTELVACQVGDPCPRVTTEVQTVTTTVPDPPGDGNGNQGNDPGQGGGPGEGGGLGQGGGVGQGGTPGPGGGLGHGDDGQGLQLGHDKH